MSIFQKYKYWMNSGKYTTIQKVAVLGFGIVSFMFLARMLSPSGFGVWGLFILISSITETARTALLRNAFIRFTHQHDAQDHKYLQGAAFTMSLALSLVLAILFLALSVPVSNLLNAPELKGILQLYALTLVISVIFSHSEIVLNANMDFRGICWMYCLRQGLLFLPIAVYFLSGMTLTPGYLSFFYLGAITISGLVGFYMARPYLQWHFKDTRPWVFRLWHFGKFVFGNNIFSQLFRSTDNFITSSWFDPVISGWYNACLRISNLVDMPSAVLADILFPKMAKFNASDKSSVKYMYERAVAATLIFSIPALLVLLIFPALILRLLAGHEFVVAAPILRVTAFFGFALPFLKQFGTVMDGTGDPNTNFKVMFFGFIINVGINLAFVSQWGVMGAAFGTATTYFVLFCVTQYLLNKRFGITIWNVFRYTGQFYKEIAESFIMPVFRRKNVKNTIQ